jgi:hypothetical protein
MLDPNPDPHCTTLLPALCVAGLALAYWGGGGVTTEKSWSSLQYSVYMVKCIFSRCFFLLGSLIYMYYKSSGRQLLIFRLLMSKFLLLLRILLLEGFQDIQPFCQLLLLSRDRNLK